MARPVLQALFRILLAAFMSAFCLQALAQQNLVNIQKVAGPPDLRLGTFIPMPTAHSQGESRIPKGLASPFAPPSSGSGGLHRGPRYPADLEYHQGGIVLPSATHHAIFVNASSACAPNSCWGDPIGFLNDLAGSGMIHLVDQYVGSTASDRYPIGTNYVVNGYSSIYGTAQFTNLDVAIIAYSVAAQTGGLGFGDIYHVFLVPGQDVCFDNTYSVCYSPDNNKTWFFCAYHGGAQDNAGNTVIYTAEPFQNVDGCSVQPGTPNGQLADSTNNSLSHESFETITDPAGNAWWNSLNNGIYGEEIGDECSFLFFTSKNVYFGPNLVRLSGKRYAIQPEYSNSQHACTTGLGD